MTSKDISNIAQLTSFVEHAQVVIVDFHTPATAQGQRGGPDVQKIASQLGIAVAEVNIEKAKDIAAKYEIEVTPSFAVLYGTINNVVTYQTGASDDIVKRVFDVAVAQAR